jgi:hypothetical protein
MADAPQCALLAEAKSAINSLNLVIKKYANTANEVKLASTKCTDSLFAIINKQIDLINELKRESNNSDILSAINGRFDSLENVNQNLCSEINELKSQIGNKSYASTLSGSAPKIFTEIVSQKPRNLVIIKPKDEKSGCKQNKHVIHSVLERMSKINVVEDVKYISKGGLIINCVTKEDTKEISNIINQELKDKFVVDKPRLKKPKIVIFGVDSEITEETIVNNITEENREIKAFLKNNSSDATTEHINVKFKFRRKTRDDSTSSETQNQRQNRYSTETWVLEVSPQLRKIIINSRSIKIGWHSCRVEDYILITRCHNCNNFGHFKKDCKAAQACGHCGQSHDSRVCQAPKNALFCVNCDRVNKNKRSNRKLNINHSVFSEECNCLKRIVNLI